MRELRVLARAGWPDGDDDAAPRPIAGFIVSSFSPLIAEVAERCLRPIYKEPPADPARGDRTAVVIVSASGDAGTAAAVADAVDRDGRVAPLLFFQAVPNSVAGHVAARWGLRGPVICLSPVGDPLREALDAAALLIDDGDADEALIVLAEQAAPAAPAEQAERAERAEWAGPGRDSATCLLVGRGDP